MTASRLSPRNLRARAWWPWAKRALTLAFFAAVAYLLYNQTQEVEWDQVVAGMRRRAGSELLLAAVLAAASYLLYSCFDLLGRHSTGHHVRTPQVMLIGFISYAFNLNMGALVGGVGFRFRLYSRMGLDAETVTRVLSLSVLTNWLGYVLLAGTVFAIAPPALPPSWELGRQALRLLGIALLAIIAAYLLLCGFARRRWFEVRGRRLTLPSIRLASLQLAMSSLNWLLIASIVHVLLPDGIGFPMALSVLLAAAVAGAIAHVPAGLGVLEAVALAMLAARAPASGVLAALFTYRVIYYLAPLAIAALAYLALELQTKKNAAGAGNR